MDLSTKSKEVNEEINDLNAAIKIMQAEKLTVLSKLASISYSTILDQTHTS